MNAKNNMTTSGPEFHRSQLAVWLAERALDHTLNEDETKLPVQSVTRYDAPKNVLQAGEVHLMRPAGGEWGPVYVLVMEEVIGGRWLVIPFGRYASPAVPGEWCSGLDAASLLVLCGWNHREVESDRLLPGGAVKRLTAKILTKSLAAMRHVTQGLALSKEAEIVFGPPLIHPADPRYVYLDEERKRLDDHAPMMAREDEGELDLPSPWLLAAEGRPRYGAKE